MKETHQPPASTSGGGGHQAPPVVMSMRYEQPQKHPRRQGVRERHYCTRVTWLERIARFHCGTEKCDHTRTPVRNMRFIMGKNRWHRLYSHFLSGLHSEWDTRLNSGTPTASRCCSHTSILGSTVTTLISVPSENGSSAGSSSSCGEGVPEFTLLVDAGQWLP